MAVRLGKGWNPPYPTTPIEKAKAIIGRLVLSMHKVSRIITEVAKCMCKLYVKKLRTPTQKAEFRHKVGIEVTEVFKGGSLGHSTAVEHHFDIDLVLYSRSEQI